MPAFQFGDLMYSEPAEEATGFHFVAQQLVDKALHLLGGCSRGNKFAVAVAAAAVHMAF